MILSHPPPPTFILSSTVQISAISLLGGCTNCTSGRFSEIEAAESPSGCKGCPKGKWSSAIGVDKEARCHNCGAGKYGRTDFGGADSEASCTKCAPGKYLETVGGVGSSLCKICPTGYYQPFDGQAFCLPCQPGSFSSTTESSECVQCSVARASTSVARVDDCDACSAGRHQPKTGMTTCLTCIP